MAVDSALKRSSATNVLLPFRNWTWPDTAGVSAAERMSAAWMYAGIAAGAVVLLKRLKGMLLGIYP